MEKLPVSNASQWEALSEKYGQNVLSQKYILWPRVHEALRVGEDDVVLDVGSGDGSYSKSFYEAGASVVGIEPAGSWVEQAREKYPGPEFVQSNIEEFTTEQRFNKILANVVICNLESKQQLDIFFKRCFELAADTAELFVTNVAPKYQKNVDTAFLVHEYPEQIEEGVAIKVSLGLVDGSTIGPFDNFHWSAEHVKETACSAGWGLAEETILEAEGEELENSPEYILFVFKKG